MAANSPASVVPRVGKNGVALSEKERLKLAKKKGVCLTCGIKTHKVSLLKRTPLTTDTVHKGVCIRCDPNEVPHGVLVAYQERKHNDSNSNNNNNSGSMNNSSNSMTLHTPPNNNSISLPNPVPFQSQPKKISTGSSSTTPIAGREGIAPRRNIPPETPAQALPQEVDLVVEEDIVVMEATNPPLHLKINDSTTATDFTVTLSNPSMTTTVLQLKEQVQAVKGIPIAQQELCLAYETLLVNDETLEHYNLLLPDNDNLQIDVFYPPEFPCTQLIIDQFGDTHPATVNPCDTLEQGIIQTIRTSPWFADQLRYMNPEEVERILLQLSWKGQDLTNTKKSLAELEIPNDSILHLEVSQKKDTQSNTNMNTVGAMSMTENDKAVAAQRQQEQAFGEAFNRETPLAVDAVQRKPAPAPPPEDPLVLAARLQQEALETAPTQKKKCLPPADLDPNDPLALAARLQEHAFNATKIQQARQERVNKKLGLSKVAGAGGTATERLSRARNYQEQMPEVKPPHADAAVIPAANNANGDDYEAPIAYESKEIRMARTKAWQQVADTKLEQQETAERERQARARLESQSKPAAASGSSGGGDDGDNYEAPIAYESKEVRMARAKAWQQVAGTKMEQEEAEERERQALARLQGKQPPSKPKEGDGDGK